MKVSVPILNADLSNLEEALAYVPKPRDLHKERAARIFNIPEDQVTPAQRREAKRQAFFQLYTWSPK